MFCTSQASTAICMSMDKPSSSSSSPGGRAIDRHNPIIRDSRRFTINPCTSQPLPINPTPYHLLVGTKKISSSSSDQITKKKKKQKKKKTTGPDPNSEPERRKSSAVVQEKDKNVVVVSGRKSWADCRTQFIADRLITPPGSSRYLLSEVALFDEIVDPGQALELVPVEEKKQNNSRAVKGGQEDHSSSDIRLSSASQHDEKPKADQVVVLRVSLHCKGCEGKVRKHLSRMEGVTSYNIDFKEKKVTIIGDVTPLGALASISKVKSAQLWTAATVPSPYATPSHAHAHAPTKFKNI